MKRTETVFMCRVDGYNKAALHRLCKANGGDPEAGTGKTGPLFDFSITPGWRTVRARNGEELHLPTSIPHVFWIKTDAAWLVILDWLLAHWVAP